MITAIRSVSFNEWGHTFWSMEEGFASPVHWGFVFFAWMTLGSFGVVLQILGRTSTCTAAGAKRRGHAARFLAPVMDRRQFVPDVHYPYAEEVLEEAEPPGHRRDRRDGGEWLNLGVGGGMFLGRPEDSRSDATIGAVTDRWAKSPSKN